MNESKRLRVLKLLTRWLEQEITGLNGYRHDLADSVFRGRLLFTENDPLPCLSILEALNPDRDPLRAGNNDNIASNKTSERWVLLLQGWSKDDIRNPTDSAYELMADVKKAVAKLFDDKTNDAGLEIDMGGGDLVRAFYLGGLVNGAEIEPGTVRPPEQNTEKAFFWMRVILKFTERVQDPYLYS